MLTKGLNTSTESPATASANLSAGGSPILTRLFILFFAQLFLLILISFIQQSGPVFVQRFFFGLDYYDFYLGASDLFHHLDPYLRGRIYTPPSSILVGLLLSWLPFKWAAGTYLVLNVGSIFASIKVLARQFGLSRQNEFALLGITAAFYPVYFVVERGNLDGIMLALLVFGFRCQKTGSCRLFCWAQVSRSRYIADCFC